MKIHILGICGTFMGGIALLARAAGHHVSGSDANVYPPMSTQLEAAGIRVDQGYEPGHLQPAPDCVVVGNAMSRGNPAVEFMLDAGLPYTSGPQWLSEQVLRDRWVLAVAGTHGKTTASSMLAWILADCGIETGFLIGGVPCNFGVSARLGDAPFFVVEADEYDTAFFDKRSKFIHYRPRTLVLNNLEFDHADIFDDLGMIQRQFHHLVRTVPGGGKLIVPADDQALREVLAMGCWTPVETTLPGGRGEADWYVRELSKDGASYDVWHESECLCRVSWSLNGVHNVANGLAAIAAARHAGVPPAAAADALHRFTGVKRRMELRGEVRGVRVYDDFAHHPTAIQTTIAGLRAQTGDRRILVLLEPRSNTMRMGVHHDRLAASLSEADRVMLYAPPDIGWDPLPVMAQIGPKGRVFRRVSDLVLAAVEQATPGDNLLVMSNGGFENVHMRLLQALNHQH